MTLILNNADVQSALDVAECLAVMAESYREQAASRAANRPTCHTYLQHSLPNATYSSKSVDGGVSKYGVLALLSPRTLSKSRSRTDRYDWKNCPSQAKACLSAWWNCSAWKPASFWRSCRTVSFSRLVSV